MYASPLSSFILSIYNAIYACLFFPALISLYLSSPLLFLSKYIPNAVYVLLPIMPAIFVFLLLAGWKGVRGALSQLIYHIKYQPLQHFLPARLRSHSSSLLFFTSDHLHLSFLTFLYLFCLHTCPPEPSSTFLMFHFFLFFNSCHMPLQPHLAPALFFTVPS